jgi:hypothetical protein
MGLMGPWVISMGPKSKDPAQGPIARSSFDVSVNCMKVAVEGEEAGHNTNEPLPIVTLNSPQAI